MRNYKMVIKNKRKDSDSESDPLLSSSSSSYGCAYGGVFRSDSYSTEIEEDVKTRSAGHKPYSINKVTQSLTLPSKIYHQKRNLVNNMSSQTMHRNSSNLSIFSDGTCALGSPKDLNGSLGQSCHELPSSTGCTKHTHSSLITIFAVWNTTMGSSLLAMAWGFEKSGLFSGILISIIIAATCLYTAYILLSINQKHGIVGENFEVPDLCRLLIGKWAEILAKIFSVLVLLGANIVYWILMSNFLYSLVNFLYDFVNGNSDGNQGASVICNKEVMKTLNETRYLSQIPIQITNTSAFDSIWDLYSTVPIFLALAMFPLLNFKSPTFFTKFNSLGTLSVGYLLIFVAIKAAGWGVNIQDWTTELKLKPSFCALSGMLSLSYFIHNIIISIMRHNKYQDKNGRDLTIAFLLITFTYVFIGTAFYISFPLAKTCIEDNILNNFSKGDTMTIIARFLLLFQLFTVFPLISFMLRNDVLVNLNTIFQKMTTEFSYKRVMIINATILLACILFACFLPRIGTLIRYTGALSGLVYIFLLPSLLKMSSLKKEKQLTKTKQVFFTCVIIVGGMNVLMQFFISDN